MTATAQDLASIRAAATARLGEQRAARVASLLAGDLDAADDLDLIQAAEDELVRRERAAALAEHKAQRARLRDAIIQAEGNRIAAITEAETAARAFVAAVIRAKAAGASVIAHATALTGRRPVTLSERDFEKTLSHHLSGLLATVPGIISYFGDLTLPPRRTPATADWADIERQRNADVIARIMETEQ